MSKNEALEWIKNNKNQYCFASNIFSKKEILSFIKKLYKLGALDIKISNILDEDWRIKEEKGPYADTLIITLPENKSMRLNLQAAIFETRPDEMSSKVGYIKNIDWNKDKTIMLWWD